MHWSSQWPRLHSRALLPIIVQHLRFSSSHFAPELETNQGGSEKNLYRWSKWLKNIAVFKQLVHRHFRLTFDAHHSNLWIEELCGVAHELGRHVVLLVFDFDQKIQQSVFLLWTERTVLFGKAWNFCLRVGVRVRWGIAAVLLVLEFSFARILLLANNVPVRSNGQDLHSHLETTLEATTAARISLVLVDRTILGESTLVALWRADWTTEKAFTAEARWPRIGKLVWILGIFLYFSRSYFYSTQQQIVCVNSDQSKVQTSEENTPYTSCIKNNAWTRRKVVSKQTQKVCTVHNLFTNKRTINYGQIGINWK